MFLGVIFYSTIFSELLDIIENTIQKAELVQDKAHYLKELKKGFDVKIATFRHMLKIIENSVTADDNNLVENEVDMENLDFRNVNQKDVDQLYLESYENRMKGLNMFRGIEKKILIEFGKIAKLYRFEPNQEIYKSGDFSEKFYVIKSGVVVFRVEIDWLDDEELEFYEMNDGYFGEMELMLENEKKNSREFSVYSKSVLEVFAIDKKVFDKLFVYETSPISSKFIQMTARKRKRIERALLTARSFLEKYKKEQLNLKNEILKERIEYLKKKFCNVLMEKALKRSLKIWKFSQLKNKEERNIRGRVGSVGRDRSRKRRIRKNQK